MATKKKVCKSCSHLVEDKICPFCSSNQLSEKYKGTIILFNAKESIIAKKLNFKDNGIYALKH